MSRVLENASLEISKPLSSDKSGENIFLFFPNILGYTRIILVLYATYSAFRSWKILTLCYCVSQILDAADGHVARYFNQATLFGSVLDQVTDRLSTVSILVLDSIIGHWIHTFASLSSGSKSHKKIPRTWPLLKLYYEHRVEGSYVPLSFWKRVCLAGLIFANPTRSEHLPFLSSALEPIPRLATLLTKTNYQCCSTYFWSTSSRCCAWRLNHIATITLSSKRVHLKQMLFASPTMFWSLRYMGLIPSFVNISPSLDFLNR